MLVALEGEDLFGRLGLEIQQGQFPGWAKLRFRCREGLVGAAVPHQQGARAHVQRAPVVREVVEAAPLLLGPGFQGPMQRGVAGVDFLGDLLAAGGREGGVVGFEIEGVDGVLLVGGFEGGDDFLGVLPPPSAEVAEPLELRAGYLVGHASARVDGLQGRGCVADVLGELAGCEAGLEVAELLVPVARDDLVALLDCFEGGFFSIGRGVDVVVSHALAGHPAAGDDEALFPLGLFFKFTEADDFVDVAGCLEAEGELPPGIDGAWQDGLLVSVLAP